MVYQEILDCGIFTVNYISNKDSNITVLCPGLAWSKVGPYFLLSKVANLLYKRNNNALLFDYYGQGDSQGAYDDVSFNSMFNSLYSVIESLRLRGYNRINLVGMGIGNILISLFIETSEISSVVFIDYDREIYENIEQYSKLFFTKDTDDKYIISEIDNSIKGRVLRALVGLTPWYRGYPISPYVFKINQYVNIYNKDIKKPIYNISKSMLHEWGNCLDSLYWKDWINCREWPNSLDLISESITGWIINHQISSDLPSIVNRVRNQYSNEMVFEFFNIQVILHIPVNYKTSDTCIIYEPGIGGDRVDHMRCGVTLSRAAQQKGFFSLRYDYPGTGISPGEFCEYTWSDRINTLNSIIEYVMNSFNIKNIFIVSFSEGAKIASWLCQNDKHVRAAVMWSPILTSEIINYYESERDNKFLPRFIKHSKYKMVLPIQGYYLGLSYFDDHKQYDFYSYIKDSKLPLKIIYGENDPFFDKTFFDNINNPLVSKTKVQNDGHLFNYTNMMSTITKTIEYLCSLNDGGNTYE